MAAQAGVRSLLVPFTRVCVLRHSGSVVGTEAETRTKGSG